MAQADNIIVDKEQFAQCRTRLGTNFIRVVGYLRDDGLKSVAAIEEAMRMQDATAMIGPSEMIKTEAFDLGAIALGEVAEHIEFGARDRVEWRQSPDDLLESVIELRRLFTKTMALIDSEASPLSSREPSPLRESTARF